MTLQGTSWSTRAFIASLILYAISLLCPVFDLQEGNYGFLLGFVCLLFGFGHLPWYANLFYFGSVVTYFLRFRALAPILAVAAVVLALTTLRIEEMPRNEAGMMTPVVGFAPGFYLWISSMLVLLIGTWLRPKRTGSSAPPQAFAVPPGELHPAAPKDGP